MGMWRGSWKPLLALLAPTLIWSCGGSSEKHAAGAAGSAQMAGSATAGTPTTNQGGSTGGKPSQAGTTSNAGEGGSAPAGGTQTVGGSTLTDVGASGASAGAGGAAESWDPELLGFACDSARCSVGQACIRCFVGDVGLRRCVPSQSADPAGFAAATAECTKPLPTTFDECDGPEDCPAAKYCVAAEQSNGFMRCREEPSSANGSCCFACGALTDCTLCRSSADCPDHVACEPAQSAPAGIMGCQRRP